MPGDARFASNAAMTSRCLFSCVFVLFVANCLAAAEPAIRVVQDKDGKPTAIEAVGLAPEAIARLAKLPADDPGLSHILAVYLLAGGRTQLPEMAGKYEVSGEVLRFTPRFALRPGLTYQAHFFPPPAGPQASPAHYTKDIAVPAPPPKAPTKVTVVYPSAAVLPENQLRFYLNFSSPMRLGEAYSHIKLLGEDGKPDKNAFLEIGEELWDPSGQRLTLLFHPGRTKRGLQPREEFGPILVPGRKYTLVIGKEWLDADGKPLAANFEKKFTAGPMVEEIVDHKQWKIAPPAARTQQPLTIRFPRPLDRGLLQWTIVVHDAAGKPLEGDVNVADEERRWEFRPDRSWAAGDYTLVADTRLEDSAGNNLARPFEVDVFGTAAKEIAPEYIRLPFKISP